MGDLLCDTTLGVVTGPRVVVVVVVVVVGVLIALSVGVRYAGPPSTTARGVLLLVGS